METIPNNVLHFKIQDTYACIDLHYIQKIISLPSLEPIPNAPREIAGLLNLSSESVYVLDLAILFNLHINNSYSEETSIVLCVDGERKFGLIVDKILGLMKVNQSDFSFKQSDVKNSVYTGIILYQDHLSLFVNMASISTRRYLDDTRKAC